MTDPAPEYTPETIEYCPVCRRSTTHVERWRKQKTASLMREISYRAVVCMTCGTEKRRVR